jgi:hypothetical protein
MDSIAFSNGTTANQPSHASEEIASDDTECYRPRPKGGPPMFSALVVAALTSAQVNSHCQEMVREPQAKLSGNLLRQFAGNNKFNSRTMSRRLDMPLGGKPVEDAPRGSERSGSAESRGYPVWKPVEVAPLPHQPGARWLTNENWHNPVIRKTYEDRCSGRAASARRGPPGRNPSGRTALPANPLE